jgi:hypothetical protein
MQRRGVVALAAAELIHRRQLDAVLTGPVVGPISAMDDDSSSGGHEALGALQPHRQSRQLGPLWGVSPSTCAALKTVLVLASR